MGPGLKDNSAAAKRFFARAGALGAHQRSATWRNVFDSDLLPERRTPIRRALNIAGGRAEAEFGVPQACPSRWTFGGTWLKPHVQQVILNEPKGLLLFER
jgi:hypothetical protein